MQKELTAYFCLYKSKLFQTYNAIFHQIQWPLSVEGMWNPKFENTKWEIKVDSRIAGQICGVYESNWMVWQLDYWVVSQFQWRLKNFHALGQQQKCNCVLRPFGTILAALRCSNSLIVRGSPLRWSTGKSGYGPGESRIKTSNIFSTRTETSCRIIP